jgi:hypothetical protein
MIFKLWVHGGGYVGNCCRNFINLDSKFHHKVDYMKSMEADL